MDKMPFNIEYVGWLSSFILILTIGKQVHTQWKEPSTRGVSKWLYLGQLGAGLGFVVYSYLVENWVFFVTNIILTLQNILGLVILTQTRAKEKGRHTRAR